jgi:hypothetical protein
MTDLGQGAQRIVGPSGRHHRSPAVLPTLVYLPPRWKGYCNHDLEQMVLPKASGTPTGEAGGEA